MRRSKNKRHQQKKTRNTTKRTLLQKKQHNWWSKNFWNIIGLTLTILTGVGLPFYFQYESDLSQMTTKYALSTVQALQSTTIADLASSNLTSFSEMMDIPAIGINAPVEQIDQAPDRALVWPTQHPWTSVGWYAKGPKFGQQGSAIVGGHLDRPGGYPGIFWDLHRLQIGNKVEVINSNEEILYFQVTRMAYYSLQNMPLKEIFGNEDGIHLNLITEAGDWIPSQRETSQRLVIYTTLAKI